MSGQKRIYQLKVTLEDIRPPVWRRIQVAEETTLGKLHRIFQTVMGWENYHLHAFRVGEVTYGEPDPDFDQGWMKNERRVKLRDIAPGIGAKFRYEYDFGDSWLHLALVEKIFEAEPGMVYPLCIGGKRACPPEDCGGFPGYEDFLTAIANPEREDHDALLQWVGGAFDPEAFDQNTVNKALRRLR
ncbi:MAG: plasmid pRiA4b ORF-3 family protein [bacterium]